MSARLEGRRRAAAAAVDRVVKWACEDRCIRAVFQVGSYARGAESMASDVDLVVIVEDPHVIQALALVCDSVWALAAGTARAWFARSPRRISTLSGVGGVMMIGLGGVLAVSGSKS